MGSPIFGDPLVDLPHVSASESAVGAALELLGERHAFLLKLELHLLEFLLAGAKPVHLRPLLGLVATLARHRGAGRRAVVEGIARFYDVFHVALWGACHEELP